MVPLVELFVTSVIRVCTGGILYGFKIGLKVGGYVGVIFVLNDSGVEKVVSVLGLLVVGEIHGGN